jgi:hypothetical protein
MRCCELALADRPGPENVVDAVLSAVVPTLRKLVHKLDDCEFWTGEDAQVAARDCGGSRPAAIR